MKYVNAICNLAIITAILYYAFDYDFIQLAGAWLLVIPTYIVQAKLPKGISDRDLSALSNLVFDLQNVSYAEGFVKGKDEIRSGIEGGLVWSDEADTYRERREEISTSIRLTLNEWRQR